MTKITTALLFVCITVAYICADDDLREHLHFEKLANATGIVCKRILTIQPQTFDFNIQASAVCKGTPTTLDGGQPGGDGNEQNDDPTLHVLNFEIQDSSFPEFILRSYANADNSSGIFDALLLFSEIVEYIENNNVTGYQPGGDTVVISYPLGQLSNNPQAVWQPIQYNTTNVDADTVIYSIYFDSNAQLPFNVRFIVDVASTPVLLGSKLILPDGFKLTVQINNFIYTNVTSNGLALGSTLFTRFGCKDDEGHRTATGNRESAVSIDGGSQFSKGGYFTWENTALLPVGGAISVINSPPVPDNSTDGLSGNSDGKTGQKIYFSLPGRPTSFEWDPSFGVGLSNIVYPNSAASTFTPSLLFAVLMAAILRYL